ncbi:MAG: tetratricopeptide repeat protein [Muribaculaceae bacterium]|nr:tetratricopeptide repeat protein [Muribaculaceae bacterium]
MKYKAIYITLSILSLALFGACSGGDEPVVSTKSERNFIVEGNELYAEGNYTEAEAAYRKALTENPNSAMAQFNLASALLRQDPKMGKNAPAPAQPQQAKEGEGQQEEQMSKQLQDAVEILKNLVENCEDPAIVSVAAYDLGNISYKQQDFGQAIECYKESLRKNPKYEDARYNLRMAQLKQKDQNKNQNKNQQNKDKNKDQDKDKDKDKNKDENKDKDQDKKDQDKNKDQQNQNKDQNKDKDKQQQQQQQQQKGGMSQQNMEQILRTMQNQENATQQRVNAARAKQQEGERSRTRNKW